MSMLLMRPYDYYSGRRPCTVHIIYVVAIRPAALCAMPRTVRPFKDPPPYVAYPYWRYAHANGSA